MVQSIVTTANVCAMSFVILTGGYLGFKTGWPGYVLSIGYAPFGVDGVLTGAATVFFAYIGFDTVASIAEEVRNHQRDLPLGIGSSLAMCCTLYMLVTIVIIGLVPYYALDSDTPISSAFTSNGMQWAAYIISVGATTALCSTLMGSLLPQRKRGGVLRRQIILLLVMVQELTAMEFQLLVASTAPAVKLLSLLEN